VGSILYIKRDKLVYFRFFLNRNYAHSRINKLHSCRLHPCNILSNCHLNHFWVQPYIVNTLKLFSSLVAPIFTINYSYSACYSRATCNQHLSENDLTGFQYGFNKIKPNALLLPQTIILSLPESVQIYPVFSINNKYFKVYS